MKLFLFLLLVLFSFLSQAQDSLHARTMDAAVVTGTKDVIRLTASKIVFNVSASPVAAGGNVYDALLRIPGLVDQGTMLFRGKTILLLLDGVDTHLPGTDLKTMLEALPCTGIDRIEVLVSPPARYDAKGMVVVNVISAKSKTMGATTTLTGGLRQAHYGGGNAGVNFRYHERNYSLSGSYDYSGGSLLTQSTSNRFVDSLHWLAEDTRGRRTSIDQTIRVAAEFTPSAKSTFSLQSTLLIYRHGFANTISDRLSSLPLKLDSNAVILENRIASYRMPTIDLGYTYRPDSSGRELAIHGGYVGYKSGTSDGQFIDGGLSQGYQVQAHNHIGMGSVDYTLPTSLARFELGGKFTAAVTDNHWLLFSGVTDEFVYRENVAAAYVNADKTLGKWSVRGGMRLEQTHTSGHSLSLDTTFVHDYTGLFPSLQLQYQASASGQWSLSYKRSIERFDFDVVNPFLRYESPYSYYRGNPAIRPELDQSIDLGYAYKDMLVFGASYLYVTDVLADTYQQTGSALQRSYANLGHAVQYNVNAAYTGNWFHGLWTSTTSVMGLYAKYIGGPSVGFTNAGFSVYAESDHSLKLSTGWMVEAVGSFTGPLAFGVYRFRSTAAIDLGVSKACCNGRGKFTLGLTDVFHTNVSRYFIETWLILPGDRIAGFCGLGLAIGLGIRGREGQGGRWVSPRFGDWGLGIDAYFCGSMTDNISLPANVAGILRQAFGINEVTGMTLLEGGLSGSAVYKLVVDGRPYVLKIDAAGGGDAGAAGRNLKLAAEAGIAPRLFYQDAGEGITISAFVESKPLRAALPGERIPAMLASTIREIHAVPVSSAPASSDGPVLWETVDGLIAEFRQVGMLAGPVFDACFAGYEQIKAVYPREIERVFSHNDLNPANVLSDGERIWVIDWDAAYANDRFMDLAVAANFFIFTPDQEATFLDTYFEGRVDAAGTARFFLMRLVARIIYGMLLLRLAARQSSSDFAHDQTMEGVTLPAFGAAMGAGLVSLGSYEGQLMYGKALVNEAVRQMGTPRFAEALSLI